MQVARLNTHTLSGSELCAWPSIRHLELETCIEVFLKHTALQACSQLETLKLRSWESPVGPISTIDLDLSCVRSLRCLHIEDWSPKSIRTAAECRVHAMWQHSKKGQEWLLSPCWRADGTNLASLHVYAKRVGGHEVMRAFRTILRRHDGLELLVIASGDLCSKKMPLAFPPCCFDSLKAPLRVELDTWREGWLHLDKSDSLGRMVVFNVSGALHVGIPAAARTRQKVCTQWYVLGGRSHFTIGEGSPLQLQLQDLAKLTAQALSVARKPDNPNMEDVAAPEDVHVDRDSWWPMKAETMMQMMGISSCMDTRFGCLEAFYKRAGLHQRWYHRCRVCCTKVVLRTHMLPHTEATLSAAGWTSYGSLCSYTRADWHDQGTCLVLWWGRSGVNLVI